MKKTAISAAIILAFVLAFPALAQYSSFSLSNGIPVHVKRSAASRVVNLSLVLRGGSLVADPAQAGWENLAFRTMVRGSASWPYERLSGLLDETSASISSSSNFEYSVCALNALDKYFDMLLPVWASVLTDPAFAQEDFEQAKSEAEMALQGKEQDPWARTGQLMNQRFFEGHPYAVSPEGTMAALAAASPEALARWRTAHFSADRMMIVAVGDFDPAALRVSLEKAFGAIPDLKLGPVPVAPAFPGKAAGTLGTEAFPQSKGVFYLRGDFPAPAPGTRAFMATNLALKLFSDILFAVVRDKYGAVYTPGASNRAFGANYGSITIYKTAAADRIKSYIDEAAAILAQGRCVSTDPTRSGEEAKFMRVEDALEAYKAMYANEYFDAVRTNAAVASLMIRSALATGDPADWLADAARIRALQPADVAAAFREVVLSGRIAWAAVGDPALVAALPAGAFAATP